LPPVKRQIPCIADNHSATTAAYRAGCSCEPARLAWRQDRADYLARRRNPGFRGARGAGPQFLKTPEQHRARLDEIRARNRALAVGAQRRLRSLLRIGHPVEYLARRLRMSPRRVSSIVGGLPGGIWPNTAGPIESLHQELQYRHGNNRDAAEKARKLGYHPPAAWHPDDLDNPAAGPTWPYRKADMSRRTAA
jgi:hypothetical protein